LMLFSVIFRLFCIKISIRDKKSRKKQKKKSKTI